MKGVTWPSGRYRAGEGKGSVLEVSSINVTQKEPAETKKENDGLVAPEKVLGNP